MMAEFRSDIRSIAEICMGKLMAGDPDGSIETITSDSRELGDRNLFIPISGENFDGHDFILPLARKGSIDCYLTMKDTDEVIREFPDTACIKCDNTLYALGRLGSYKRVKADPRVIGITGTNGKTTVKELVYSISAGTYATLKNEKNFNNEIGVPFTLLKLHSSHEVAVIEMGMNHAGEIERLSEIVKPDTAVITNIGEGHLEFLGTTRGVAESKMEIVHGMEEGSILFLNADSLHIDFMKKKAADNGIVVKTFGIDSSADFYPETYSLSENGVSLRFMGLEMFVPVYGIHNLYNVMGALAVSSWLDVDISAAGESLADFKNIEGRSQVINRGYILINDTYNSNPLSSRMAVESISRVYPGRRKIAVLSDMKELGAQSETLHRETGRFVGEKGFNMLLAWGEMSGFYIEGALESGINKNCVIGFSAKQALSDYLNGILTDDDVVLVKGSRSMKMEDVVKSLKEKT